MRKSLLFIFIIFLYSCESKLCYKEFSISEMKELYKESELNKDFLILYKEYRLSKKDIELTTMLIKKAFSSYNNNLSKNGYRMEPLSSYKNCSFLLTPSINNNGETIVFVNAYCNNSTSCSDLGSLEDWFGTMDGGNSMIRFVINLTKKTFSNITPNGEA